MLRCPICKKALIHEKRQFFCENKHSFDQAKQGYVNLSLKQKVNQGDNKEMVKARTAFLEKDAYDFMRQRVIDLLKENQIQTLVDLGCGQGYYTSAFQSVCSKVIGVDLSKDALIYASKQNKAIQYIVASIYDLPLMDACCDGVTSLFVGDADQEIHRILKENGLWITVSPGPKHCWELKELLYQKVLENPLPSNEKEGFELVDEQVCQSKKTIDDLWSLLEMTPYRYKSPKEGLENVRNTQSKEITFEFIIRCFRKK